MYFIIHFPNDILSYPVPLSSSETAQALVEGWHALYIFHLLPPSLCCCHLEFQGHFFKNIIQSIISI